MVCGVSLILQNATYPAEAACPKDVVQGRQWKSNYSLSRPYDPTEGFPVLVCAVDVPCSDTVCDDTFNATVVKRLKQLGRQVDITKEETHRLVMSMGSKLQAVIAYKRFSTKY